MHAAGIDVSEPQMMKKFVKHMYCSGHFDEQDMTKLDKTQAAYKTDDNAKAYFLEKYKEKIMYCKATARNMGYVNKAAEVPIQLAEVLT